MAFIESQANAGVTVAIDPAFAAMRISPRPLDHTAFSPARTLGHYKVFGQSSAVAPASGIFGALRWTDTGSVCVLTRAYTCVTVVTAVTAQRLDPLLLKIARAYTVRDLTNATSLLPTGRMNSMRSSMGTTLVANVDTTSTAAGATGGTSTVDTNSVGAAQFNQSLIAIGSGMVVTDLYRASTSDGAHPIVLAANEGVQILWGTTTLATGTVTVGVGFEWAELPAY